MRDSWERACSGLLTIAGVVIAAALVHREFSPAAAAGPVRPKSEYMRDWRNMLSAARSLSDTPSRGTAPVTVVEFTDFECPFCRRFNTALAAVRAKYPSQVAVAVVHFPLPGHPQGVPAAQAAECAAARGRFGDAVDLLFTFQDSLGKKPWAWFASRLGIKDTAAFTKCMGDSIITRLVAAGLALGERNNVNATPTVILNGWRYGVAPRDTEFIRAVGDILAGRKPYKGFPAEALAKVAAQ